MMPDIKMILAIQTGCVAFGRQFKIVSMRVLLSFRSSD